MKLDWRQIIAALVVGLIVGSLGTLRCERSEFRGAWKNPRAFQKHMMEHFTDKLKLTPGQKEKVSAILNDARSKIDVLRQEVRPRFEEVRNSSRAEILKLLMPEQRKKFDEMTAQRDARRLKKTMDFS